ncbi:MAG: hypothetical protein ACFFCQ_16530 [Promethearchaeota archaeon]
MNEYCGVPLISREVEVLESVEKWSGISVPRLEEIKPDRSGFQAKKWTHYRIGSIYGEIEICGNISIFRRNEKRVFISPRMDRSSE